MGDGVKRTMWKEQDGKKNEKKKNEWDMKRARRKEGNK